ncbi:substrate-binding domain-containing protein [Pectinatus brassicae]|uniref:DNA-binding LacI/PurR family transcriptional regulator n=1 Tax=Pectinatus brassicae TaxID=862415 RepID=A0A840UI13_9FIRM|nr:substrate-binding domain-containing protein [Pectinatus brassicae]MBB5337381.1 DNA-binding LacI/PurR family transcriptional regulator [Pectinatus brassicae]
MCTFIDPELSSIAVPIDKLGTIAVRRLMEKIDKPLENNALNISVETTFIKRGSIGENNKKIK